uniref:Peptidase S1 domain-containing protein n=1 Tax=Timema monikensis TaxID=170555 RepID=A0A7R9HTE7_9NEOP|nr:unnamed protein product [Timema monikensis]
MIASLQEAMVVLLKEVKVVSLQGAKVASLQGAMIASLQEAMVVSLKGAKVVSLQGAKVASFQGAKVASLQVAKVVDNYHIHSSLEASEYLLYVEIPVLEHSECVHIYGSSIVTDQIICTQSTNGESTCSGDSGGPLVIMDSEGTPTQIGLVSFGAKGLCVEYPTGYTNVAASLAWILQNTGLST